MLGFPLGILSAAGAGGAVAGSYDLLETTILGSATSFVTFSSLATYASDYKHLQVRMVVRTDRGATNDQIDLQFNADTGANYSRHTLVGDGSAVTSNAGVSETAIKLREIETSLSVANVYNAIVLDILDPYNASKNTTIRALNGTASRSRIKLTSGAFFNTASLTEMKFAPIADFVAGSRFSLYGLKG